MTRLANFALTLLIATVFAAAADAQSKATPQAQIPPQPLIQALTTFADQTGLQLMYVSDLAEGRASKGAPAGLTPEQTLTRLLEGTDLTYEFLNDRTIAIKSRKTTSTAKTIAHSTSGENPPSPREGRRAGDEGLMRVAQNEEQSSSKENKNPESPQKDSKVEDLSEVIVTGTHIRGVQNSASPVIVIGRKELDQSGRLTAAEVIKTLPQSFSGGTQSTVFGDPTGGNSSNIASTDTANLRGLGSESTLVLINGRRTALSAFSGSSNLSAIPLSAVDRVEVLTDGASAIYGADAVGGVVNFILRKDFDGAETAIALGDTTRGGAADRRASQLLGTVWSSGSALLNYEYFESDPLRGDQRRFTAALPRRYDLVPDRDQHSAYISATQELAPGLELVGDALFSTIDVEQYSANVDDPGNFAVSGDEQFGVSAGVHYAVSDGWDLAGTTTIGRDDVTYRSRPLSEDPSVTTDNARNDFSQVEITANGALFEHRGGAVRGVVGAGYRQDKYFREGFSDETLVTSLDVDREVGYSYIELFAPIVGASNARPGLAMLELTTALRYEDYRDIGSASSPKVGIAFRPFEQLTLRGTWSKAFRTARLDQLYGPTNALIFSFPDPLAGGQSVPVLFRNGANDELKPETAEPWTVGFDYVPVAIPGAKISATYFNTKYRSRIAQPLGSIFTALTNPVYAPLIMRDPSPELQQAIIDEAVLFLNLSGAPYDPATIRALVNGTNVNVATQEIHGVDLLGAYQYDAPFGALGFTANASWLTLRQQITAAAPTEVLSGYVFRPAKFKARFGTDWQRGLWSAALYYNYTDGSVDNSLSLSQPRKVSAFHTVDLQLGFRSSRDAGLLSNVRGSISVLNALDRSPPGIDPLSTRSDAFGLGYDSTNASPLGRVVRLSISKGW